MFAVPGWSVSADALRTQEDPARKIVRDGPVSKDKTDSSKTSKKRKRVHGQGNGVNVTEENLADLWRKHIEGRNQVADSNAGDTLKGKKKRKKERALNGFEGPTDDVRTLNQIVKDPENSVLMNEENKGEKNVHTNMPTKVAEPRIAPAPVNGDSIEVEPKKNSKANFEERKRRALERKEKKALLQANGSIPPPRPTQNEDVPVSSKSHSPPISAKTKKPLPVSTNSEGSKVLTPAKASKVPSITAETKPLSQQAPPKSQPQAPASTLTPLQQSMQSKLISARFRHLNQTLYTTPSTQASQLFTETPSAFSSYHAGFRAQVVVWPQNPVNTFIEDVKARGKIGTGRDSQKKLWRQERKVERKGKGKGKTDTNGEAAAPDSNTIPGLEPLPRTRGICTLADLGCGDASFAAALKPIANSMHLRLHSFDLAQGDGPNASLITVADIANLPLPDGSVDVAVLCLALMGTNWIDFVEEVGRVVRWGGECWVAEIKSRFGRPALKKKGIGKKKGDEEEEQGFAEVEEETRTKEGEKTDVSGFVEVWRRRGFELKGEVEVGNKMFVRMRFVKKLTPTKGKGVPKDDGLSHGKDEQRGTWKLKGKKKFLDDTQEDDVDEAKVLKPCVYKTR